MDFLLRMSSNTRYKSLALLLVVASLAGCASDSGKDSAAPAVAPPTQPGTQPPSGTPVISGTPVMSVQATTNYAFQPTASDPDGNALAYSIANRPTWATLNTASGALTGTPSAMQTGTYAGIVISVTDGTNTASLPAFSIQVTTAPNRAPTISGTPATTVQADMPYSFQPTATDPENNPLTFSVEGAPSWTTFNASTGRLSGTPTSANVGITNRIIFRVADGTNVTALSAFNLTVTSVTGNTAPVISGTPGASVVAGVLYSFTPTASDANGDALTYSVVNAPLWAVFNTATGQLSGLPSIAATHSNITIRVSDGQATVSLPAFSIAVRSGTVGNATLTWATPTNNTDGSALTDLGGYRIVYGTSSNTLDRQVQLTADRLTHTIDNLVSGTWYFAIRAYSTADVESSLSAIMYKTIQ
ncbi:MAG: hypothetical protein H7Y02_10930 [Candidatus Obscuribacterales bacterium]|nr:hypothetical protein [Steroidobacteraceae bacterium]